MKIVQTYWTKPMFQKSGELYNRLQGGWPSLKYALCAMAYSCLSIKKFYPNIELVTDSLGYNLLIEELSLPYSKVDLSLNNFDVDPNLWALAKVYSYSLQQEPFIHVDNDIFIWGKFPSDIENSALCCQNFEQLSKDYSEGLSLLKKYISFSNSLFENLIYNDDYLNNCFAVNAGILGGNNVDFIKFYSQYILDFYKTRKHEFEKVGECVGLLNIILEQLSFGVLSKEKNININCLKHIADFDELINNIIDIYSTPIKTKYVHCLGNIKKDVFIAQQIEFHLKSQYPDYYDKINEYCIKNGFANNLDIDMNRFNIFENVYNLLSLFDNVSDFMKTVQFRLNSNHFISLENGVFLLTTPNNNIPLSGWGKIMTHLDRFKTGNDIVNEFLPHLQETFNKEEIEDNVFSFLLHTIYCGNLIEFRVP